MLLLDDDAIVRSAFANGMRRHGIRVTPVATYGEAAARARADEFPVIVVDYRLDDLDGLEAIERLHRLSPTSSFVLVTGEKLSLPGHTPADRVTYSLVEKPWEDDAVATTLRRAACLHAERARAPSPTRLLLVEDNPADAAWVTELLALDEASVARAARLDEALDAVHARDFTLVIADLTLPDARGLDAVTRLRDAAPGAALIVLSGVIDPDLERQALRFGAQECLPKDGLDAAALERAVDLALERHQAHTRLLSMVRQDPLTKLANRTALEEALGREMARWRRTNEICGVLFVDLDGFKPVNDTHGHDAGDAVLRTVAARIEASVRDADLAVRLGGDEFAVLLCDIDTTDAATEVAERVRRAVSAPVAVGATTVRVGASIGVALAGPNAPDPSALLAAADAAMYVAKRAGKDAVSLAG